MIRRAILTLAVLALGGCGTYDLAATVTRFHRALPAPGQTFTILPKGDQVGSIEFDVYAQRLASHLESLGYRPVPASGRPADLVVTFDYGVDNGRSELVTTPPYGQDVYWQRYYCSRVPLPFDCYDPIIQDVQSYTVFNRWVDVQIVDGASARGSSPVKLFEGRANSEGSSRNLPEVVPALIGALFVDFPGANGQTRTVTVPRQPAP